MPLLTLTSDIGPQDYLISAVKARLLAANPDFNIIDISHSIAPFNYPQTAYLCRNAINNFPAYTYHLILVNLFEKNTEHLLLAFHNNQYILCADNGILTMILEEKPELVIGIPIQNIKPTLLNFINAMGETVNKLVSGEALKNIGTEEISYTEKKPLRPVTADGFIEAQIIFIDNFENVVVNITEQLFEKERKDRKFKIVFKRDESITAISNSYADVPDGEKLAMFNSAGYLEIAINKGNAAGLFGLKGFSERSAQSRQIAQNQLFYQTVRIYFE